MSAADRQYGGYRHALLEARFLHFEQLGQRDMPNNPPHIPDDQTYPYIYEMHDQEIYVQLAAAERTCFILDCTCPSCIQNRDRVGNVDALLAAWRAAADERAARLIQRDRERKAADHVAKQRLLALLPQEEAEQLRDKGAFAFTGQSGARYSISIGYSGNVFSIDRGRSFCCYLNQSDLPTFDHMIGQYLALKYNEELFLKTAY